MQCFKRLRPQHLVFQPEYTRTVFTNQVLKSNTLSIANGPDTNVQLLAQTRRLVGKECLLEHACSVLQTKLHSLPNNRQAAFAVKSQQNTDLENMDSFYEALKAVLKAPLCSPMKQSF